MPVATGTTISKFPPIAPASESSTSWTTCPRTACGKSSSRGRIAVGPGTPAQKIGDYYAAYLDQAAIEANGLGPVQDDLKRISAASSKQDIATVFGLAGFASLFDIDLPPDLKNPDQYSVVISQSHLGLPDRDYYLKDDPKLQEFRTQYTAYIEKILTLGGIPDAHAKARDIMAFETEAAKLQWPIEKRRDVDATYNPRTKAQLLAYAPGFAWQSFLDASEIGSRQELILSELDAIKDLAALFNRTPLPTLKAYLTFHYLSDHAPHLPQRFDAARLISTDAHSAASPSSGSVGSALWTSERLPR